MGSECPKGTAVCPTGTPHALRLIPVAVLAALAASACPAPATESSGRDQPSTASVEVETPPPTSNPAFDAAAVDPSHLGSLQDRDDSEGLADIVSPLGPVADSTDQPKAHTAPARLDSVGIRDEVVEPAVVVPPANRRDPAAVVSYVVIVWSNRSPQRHQWPEAITDWVTPQLAGDQRVPAADQATEAATVRADVLGAQTSTGPLGTEVIMTVEQVSVRGDRVEPRVMVYMATMVEDADGWRVAWLERS